METQDRKKRKNYNKYTPVDKKSYVNDDLTEDDIALAARLKQFRVKYIAKTLQEAKEKTGLPPSTINGMELGKTKVSLTLLQIYKDQYGLNMEWAATGIGADRVGASEPTAGRSMQKLVDLVNSFQLEISNMNFRVNSLVKENNALKKRVKGLEDDMRDLNRTQ